jgi:hypothetical protein
MTHGERESVERARWSDFERFINPNGKLIENLLKVLVPLAGIAVVLALVMIVTGGASIWSLLVIFALGAFFFSGSGASEPLSRR